MKHFSVGAGQKVLEGTQYRTEQKSLRIPMKYVAVCALN